MDIALLYFDGCPHAQAAETNLRAALADLDSGDVVVRKQLVETVEEAERVGFLRLSVRPHRRARPVRRARRHPGLSCRVYAADTGSAGTPTVAQLRDALAAATAATARS